MTVVPIKNGINFRDLGGIVTMDGRQIRPGMLYRAGTFAHITPSEGEYLANQLKLHYVIDYRDQKEIEHFPDRLWHNANYINVPANPLNDDVTASLTSDLEDDNQILKKRSPFDFMVKLYQQLPFNNPAYQKLTSIVLNADGKPLVQHCAVGKDRTGVGVALILFALGVSEDNIMQDYLLTEQLLANYREWLLNQDKEKYKLSPDELKNRRQIFAAKKEYLLAAINAIKERYGTINSWLAKEYQLDEKNKEILQQTYLI